VSTPWRPGNRVRLLENGEAFFPAVFESIRAARHEVLLETFILWEDKVGWELHGALLEGARRGVQVDVLVDGFGSWELTPKFTQPLIEAGVRLRVFDQAPRFLGKRANLLRRMHRKIVVVDGQQAFVGGINYSGDHLADFGPEAKQDYAVELEGPIVDDIRRFAIAAIGKESEGAARAALPDRLGPAARPAGPAEARFVTRDNVRHTNDIEREYRAAIRLATRRVLIANAYFFPGYRLLRELRHAARRGVDVQLILQGEPDLPIVQTAARLLYGHLQRDGVQIHEYCKRPLHGKVAVIDDDWSTVGSSNLDPLSLSLNLEANVVLRDAGFASRLAERLLHLVEHECRRAEPPPPTRWRWWPRVRSAVVFHFLRHFPLWACRLPPHAPKLQMPAVRGAPAEPAPGGGRPLGGHAEAAGAAGHGR
jgi:cardiolipin synthase